MSVLTILLPTPLCEGTTGVYTFQVVDEASLGIEGSQLNSLTLTYYDLATGAILNNRDGQNVLNTNNVTLTTVSGPPLVTTVAWDIRPEDTILHDVRRETEQHIALFQWAWGASTKHAAHKVQLGIEALVYTLALP